MYNIQCDVLLLVAKYHTVFDTCTKLLPTIEAAKNTCRQNDTNSVITKRFVLF